MKKINRTQFLDKAHLYTVRTLMGITVVGIATLGLQIYTYVTKVRPERLQEKYKVREQEIAYEQQEREAELLRRQKEAEELVG